MLLTIFYWFICQYYRGIKNIEIQCSQSTKIILVSNSWHHFNSYWWSNQYWDIGEQVFLTISDKMKCVIMHFKKFAFISCPTYWYFVTQCNMMHEKGYKKYIELAQNQWWKTIISDHKTKNTSWSYHNSCDKMTKVIYPCHNLWWLESHIKSTKINYDDVKTILVPMHKLGETSSIESIILLTGIIHSSSSKLV